MNMSKHVNCELSETKTAADNQYEEDGFIHSLSVRVEYYRSLEYCLKWKSHMNTRHSSKLRNASKKSAQKSPTPNKDVSQRQLRSKSPRTGLRNASKKSAQKSPSPNKDVSQRQLRSKSPRTGLRNASKKSAQKSPSPNKDVSQRRTRSKSPRTGLREAKAEVNTDEGSSCDLIDLINAKHDVEDMTLEDEGKFVEVADEGVDDEDRFSDNSSIASGPSFRYINSPKKPDPSQEWCSACWKRYQKAKTMKAPIKDKLLDNDPSSLTCDQWVLLKEWRPRRLLGARGNLLMHVQRVKRGAKKSKQYLGDSSACSRPHTFLQRNLRRCVKVPVKKGRKNRRKRARNDSQGSRIAKQKRLRSNIAGQHTSVNCAGDNGLHPARGHSSSPGFESCSNEENDDEADMCLELIPSSVTLLPANPVNVSHNQKAAKQTAGFRGLLAQLRGNSSMIVRETR